MELFRSEDLSVRRVGDRGGTLVVTFGSYTDEPTLDRAGFGERFLRRERIDAIHVINRVNRWYQHPETAAALAAVRAVAQDYERVITYGSSMGGYAALRFAAACGADTAIALSPQYSVDPAVAPWETRWQPDVAQTTFAEPAYDPVPRQYIFYDPRVAPDDRHVALFAAAAPAQLVPLPFGGHPVSALLAETGALQAALRAIVESSFDPADVRARVRAGRRRSQHVYFTLARRATPRRPELAVRLLDRAEAIEPESHIVSAKAALLDRLGRHDEAAPLHRAAVERTPTNALAWIALALHREATGDAAGAADALRRAIPGQSGSTLLRVRTMQLRMWLRRHRLGAVDRLVDRAIRRIDRSSRHALILRLLGRGLR